MINPEKYYTVGEIKKEIPFFANNRGYHLRKYIKSGKIKAINTNVGGQRERYVVKGIDLVKFAQ